MKLDLQSGMFETLIASALAMVAGEPRDVCYNVGMGTSTKEVSKSYLVTNLVQRQIDLGKRGDDLESAVSSEIRRYEGRGADVLWPPTDYYVHEAAFEATLRPDGSMGNPNAYYRYLIGDIASSLRKVIQASSTSSSESSCNTSDDLENECSPEEGVFVTFDYTPWENSPGEEWMEWPVLFKFACSIVHSLYGTYIHYTDFEDLMQEAWEAVYTKALPNFDPSNGAKFTSFAYTVMRNHLMDVYRRESRWRSYLDHGLDLDVLPPSTLTL